MDDSDLLCPICKVDKKDLELRCSHEFCQKCISKMEIQKDYRCPECRQPWREEQAEGTAARKSAPRSNYDSKLDAEIECPEHEKPIDFWCDDCKELTCKKCVSSSHKSHNFKPTEDFVHGMKGYIDDRLKTKRNDVDEQVRIIKNRKDKLKKLDEDLVKFQSAVKKDKENWRAANDVRDEYLDKTKEIDDLLEKGNGSNIACVYSRCSDIISTCPKEEFPKVTSDDLISNLMQYGAMKRKVDSTIAEATETVQQRQKDEKEKFQAEIRTLKEKINNLKRDEEEFAEESNNKFQEILREKEGEMQQLKEDCQNLRDRLQTDLRASQKAVKGLKKEKNDFLAEENQKNEQIESLQQIMKEERDSHTATLRVKDGEIQQLKEECDNLRQMEAQLQAEFRASQEAIEILMEEKNNLLAEANNRRKQIEGFELRVKHEKNSYTVTLGEKDGEIQQLKEDCGTLRHKETQFQAQIRTLQEKINSLKRDEEEFAEESNNKFKATVCEKDGEIKKLNEEIDNFRDWITRLQDDLKDSQKETRTLKKEKKDNKKLEQTIKDNKKHIEKLENTIKENEKLINVLTLSSEEISLSSEAGEVTPEAGESTPEAGEGTPEAGEGTPEAGESKPEAGNNV